MVTVYPKKYAHGFCFAVLCCGYTLTDFPISIRLTSLALGQSNDCPSASKATLMNMDEYFMWIHYKRLHNHNKAKHNKTVCIFLGIYCIWATIVNPPYICLNHMRADYCDETYNHIPILYLLWNDAGNHVLEIFLIENRVWYTFIFKTNAADDMGTQKARASAAAIDIVSPGITGLRTRNARFVSCKSEFVHTYFLTLTFCTEPFCAHILYNICFIT